MQAYHALQAIELLPIGGDTFEYVSYMNAPSQPTLAELNWVQGMVADDEFSAFYMHRNLDLWHRACTDDDLRHLRELPYVSNLDLEETHVTDAALVHLHGLHKMKTLKLRGTKVTAEGVERLRKALPDCKVRWR